LECLRMVKGALLLKEKETGSEVPEDEAVAVLRSEVRKRRQSIDVFREHGKEEEAAAAEAEIGIIEAFLPQQLTPEQTEEKVRAYLAEHPEINHAGRLTGALKKELGDQVDGKTLNDVCRKVLEG
ncbi:MAG: GatB/YqeY domain-containing protein, partial [Candidatus Hydrogenedentes bacterium]|nr:GatB/YqeY domain-containing protein [Candidatus Hydrogenedentota bacterium]